jgi:hypothetical protein
MVWQAWIFSAITSLAVLTGIAAAGWTALRLLRRYATRGTDAEPACGRCGYLIHPGSRRRCPECGSDLAEVGVVTPSTFPPIYPVLGLWLGAVGFGYVATELGPRVAAATPWGWTFRAEQSVWTSRYDPRYLNSQGVFGVQARGIGRRRGTRVREIRAAYVTPMPSDRIVVMEVDPRGEWCRIDGGDREPLNGAAVRRFVRRAEFAPGDADGDRAALEVWDAVRGFVSGDFATGTAVYSQPSVTAERVVTFTLWAAPTAAIAFVLHRMHRRLRRRVARRAGHVLDELQLAA